VERKKATFSACYKYSAIQSRHQEVAQKLPELLTSKTIWMDALLDFLTLANKVVSS